MYFANKLISTYYKLTIRGNVVEYLELKEGATESRPDQLRRINKHKRGRSVNR